MPFTLNDQRVNPFTLKISSVILLTVCHTIPYVSSENLVFNQLIIHYLIFFSILITCLFDMVLI